MDDHPGWLVDHDQVGILIDHFEWNRLGDRRSRIRLRDLDLDHIPGGNAVGRLSWLAIDSYQVTLDEACCRGAAQIGRVLRDKAVEPRCGCRRD